MRRRRRSRGLGATHCRIGESARERGFVETGCVTEGKTTFCVGDQVVRKDTKGPGPGHVIAVGVGKANSGAKKKATLVCWNSDEPNELAYPYLFSEIKKKK